MGLRPEPGAGSRGRGCLLPPDLQLRPAGSSHQDAEPGQVPRAGLGAKAQPLGSTTACCSPGREKGSRRVSLQARPPAITCVRQKPGVSTYTLKKSHKSEGRTASLMVVLPVQEGQGLFYKEKCPEQGRLRTPGLRMPVLAPSSLHGM